MATFTYYPMHPETKNSALRLYIRWNSNTVRYSPGISVAMDYWDQEAQCLKKHKNYPEAESINMKLLKLMTKIRKKFEDLEESLDRLPVKAEVNAMLKEFLHQTTTKSGAFKSYWENRMYRMMAELQADGKKVNRNSVVSSYRQTLQVMIGAIGSDLQSIGFDDVNDTFYIKILQHCTQTLNHSPNNIGKHIKNIKAVMANAEFDGLHNNRAYKKFKMPTEEVHDVYLTRDEIERIFNLELNGELQRLASSRDFFVIACSTGLRFGDWSQLFSLNLEGDTVRIIPEKTKSPIVIPLSKRVKEILSHYPEPPKVKENQPLNRDLKEIAKLAGICDLVSFHTTRGGKRTEVSYEKWEMVSTHTARRSFATNLYLQGAPVLEIMKITGHKTETQFLKYIKITKNDAAKKLSAFID